MNKGVTILICSYNGASRLPSTIKHVAAQVFVSDIEWEVIVIDNASTDNSGVIAKNEWEKCNVDNVDFKIVTEPNPGKIYALQNGVSKAKFDYFIICDDDNWLHENYAETVYQILEANPLIGAVGGQSTAVTDGQPLPFWFKQMEADYAVGIQAPASGDVTKRGYLWGAGLGSRTALFKSMYEDFPSLLTGRKEKLLTAGEDTEYCLRLILKGYTLYYDSRLEFRHFIPGRRLEEAYRVGLINGLNESNVILDKYYLAARLMAKCDSNVFNKIRLIIITPFRYLLASSKEKKYLEKTKLSYLLPFDNKKDVVMQSIKKFIAKGHLPIL